MRPLLFAMLLGLSSSALSDVILHITESSGFHGVSKLNLNDEYAGNIGDYLFLQDGIHKLSYPSMHDFYYYITINVSGGSAELTGQDGYRMDDCVNGRVSPYTLDSWSSPKLVDGGVDGVNVYSLDLGSPQYKRKSGALGECTELPSLGTLQTLGKAKLSITSEPTGARIFVAGEDVGQTNNVKIIPFRENDESLRVVLKLDGYANCIRDIDLPEGDFEASVECTFRPVGVSH